MATVKFAKLVNLLLRSNRRVRILMLAALALMLTASALPAVPLPGCWDRCDIYGYSATHECVTNQNHDFQDCRTANDSCVSSCGSSYDSCLAGCNGNSACVVGCVNVQQGCLSDCSDTKRFCEGQAEEKFDQCYADAEDRWDVCYACCENFYWWWGFDPGPICAY